MRLQPIPAALLFLSLVFTKLPSTTSTSNTQIFFSLFRLDLPTCRAKQVVLPTSPDNQPVHHVKKLCKEKQKSISNVRLVEPCWKSEICYLNTQDKKCIKAGTVDKLIDQLDQVGDLMITQTAIYKIPLIENLPSDFGFLFHAFVVFHTPDSPSAPWWSIEKTIRSLIIQRGVDKAEVLDFRDGEKRWESLRGLPRVVVEDRSRVLLSELLKFLHDSDEVNHGYHGIYENCQDFAKRIFNRLATCISAW